jgi:Na+-translocating ferredoxin:NAD+ oxidoreductase RnfA subunit
MRNWLLAGFLLLLSLGSLPLMGGYRALSYQYGTGFTLPFILVLSGVVSLYVGLFALSHLDELATRFNLRSFSN